MQTKLNSNVIRIKKRHRYRAAFESRDLCATRSSQKLIRHRRKRQDFRYFHSELIYRASLVQYESFLRSSESTYEVVIKRTPINQLDGCPRTVCNNRRRFKRCDYSLPNEMYASIYDDIVQNEKRRTFYMVLVGCESAVRSKSCGF